MSRSTLSRKMVKCFFAAIFFAAITTVLAAQTVSFTPVTQSGGGLQSFQKAVDLNNDGREDLFVFPDNSHTSFNILLSTADGTYKQVGPFATPDNADIFSVAFGDFNGDGFADVIVEGFGNNVGGLYEFQNNGDGTFRFFAKFVASPSQVVTGDFNHDGKIDVAFLSGSISNGDQGLTVWFGNGDGTFTIGPTTPFPSDTGLLFVGDFDGDGNADLMTQFSEPSSSRPTDVTIFFGDSRGHFTPTRVCCTDRENVSAADVNGDGIMDLIGVTFPERFVQVHYGSRARTFTGATIPVQRFNASVVVAVADVNGDGIPDLILNESANANLTLPLFLSVKLGNGDGTFKPEQDIYSSNFFFTDPVVLRGNVDTKPDLLIRQTNQATFFALGGDVVTLLNTSTGNFPACAAPNAFTGINVCSPGATAASSPVHFSIGAAGQTQMRKIEVWVDGVKNTEQLIKDFSNYAFLDTDLTIPTGTHSIEVFAAGWDNLLQHSAFSLTVGSTTPPPPVPVGAADFGITAAAVTSTVKAGQAASYTVNVASQNGFTGAVTFACAGLPTSATCVFNPNPLAVTAAGGSSTLQIATTGASASLSAPRLGEPSGGVMGGLASLSFGVFGMCLFAADGRKRKNRWMVTILFAFIVTMLLLIVGCGGGNSSMTTTPPPTSAPPPAPSNATPAGTYAVTITGTSGMLQHTTTVQLVVQ